MVSVCMATYNGSAHITDQVMSILKQLEATDELIISDDGSTDATIELINKIGDPRIRIVPGIYAKNPALNFENVLNYAKGDYIFLSDQDDIWHPDKVKTCLKLLDKYDLVVSDCEVVDDNLQVIAKSFFEEMKSGPGLLKNLTKNTYLGCCMAFKSSILTVILPFPKSIPMHDIWIGFAAELTLKPVFLPVQLLKYRRHGNNVSTTTGKSTAFFFQQINNRLNLLINIPLIFSRYYRTYKAKDKHLSYLKREAKNLLEV